MATFASPPQINPLVGANPLQDLLAGFTTGRQLAQLPQQEEQAALQAQLAAALNQAKLAQIQDALANPNRELENALRLEAVRAGNAQALETLKENKPFFSENLGADLFRTNGVLQGRRVPMVGESVPVASSLFTGEAPNLGVPEAPALTFEQPPATDLSSQLQQLVTGSVPTGPSTLTGRLAQEEEARSVRDELARQAAAEKVKSDRSFKTSEREANQEFLTGMADRKAKADAEKAKSTGSKPSAEVEKQYLGLNGLTATIPALKAKIEELKKNGIPEPTTAEQVAINIAYQNPEGVFDSLMTSAATGSIRPEIADLEVIRAAIESDYTVSKAGLSQTAGEIGRTIPVAPGRFDSWDRMLIKANGLDELVNIKKGTFEDQFPSLLREGSSKEKPSTPKSETVPTRGTAKSGNKFELAK